MMVTYEQILQAAEGLVFTPIECKESGKGIRFDKDGCTVEIMVGLIAVKDESADNLSWEFRDDPDLDDVKNVIDDPVPSSESAVRMYTVIVISLLVVV